MQIREMRRSDIDAVAALRVRAWQHAYRGSLPQAYLDGLSVAADAERRRAAFDAATSQSATEAAADKHRVTSLVAELPSDGQELPAPARETGRLAGWLALGPGRDADVAPPAGEVYALYVRTDLIGTPVGWLLLQAGLHAAASRNLSPMRLWVHRENARARRFYERAGFAADGAERPYDVGGLTVDALRYRLCAPRPEGG